MLFYRKVESEGGIQMFDAVDFYLMDIGSAAHTEYEITPAFTKYMIANELLDCNVGNIHSHNTMSVFFSGEDVNDLYTNVKSHNMYLSLIVNNRMEFSGRLATNVEFKGDAGYLDTAGAEIKVTNVSYKTMGYFEVKFLVPAARDTDLLDRIAELQKEKTARSIASKAFESKILPGKQIKIEEDWDSPEYWEDRYNSYLAEKDGILDNTKKHNKKAKQIAKEKLEILHAADQSSAKIRHWSETE